MKNLISTLALPVLLTAGLSGCAGGSGDNSPAGVVPSTLQFPLQSAFKSLVANGYSKSFSVTGTCIGTGNKTAAATTTATFESVPVFSAVETMTATLDKCTPSSIAQTFTSYYDSNYFPLGFNSVGVNYGVYLTAPIIPLSVTVGGTAIVGTVSLYTDSTKGTSNGKEDLSYVVEAETANTAIVNLISKIYNSSNQLTSTEQDRFRIATTGPLVPISADIQYSNGSSTHLVITYN